MLRRTLTCLNIIANQPATRNYILHVQYHFQRLQCYNVWWESWGSFGLLKHNHWTSTPETESSHNCKEEFQHVKITRSWHTWQQLPLWWSYTVNLLVTLQSWKPSRGKKRHILRAKMKWTYMVIWASLEVLAIQTALSCVKLMIGPVHIQKQGRRFQRCLQSGYMTHCESFPIVMQSTNTQGSGLLGGTPSRTGKDLLGGTRPSFYFVMF